MLTVCENRQPGGRETNGEIRTRGALAKEGEGAQRGSRIRCLQSARYANSRRASQTGNRTTRITSRRRPEIAKLRLSRESVNYFFVSSSYHLGSRLNCDYCRGPFSLSLSLSSRPRQLHVAELAREKKGVLELKIFRYAISSVFAESEGKSEPDRVACRLDFFVIWLFDASSCAASCVYDLIMPDATRCRNSANRKLSHTSDRQ